ncbi:MAG: M28 family peptidase, partial [Planctomycetota bacterium]
HYLADAAEAFFDWMAQTNIEHVHTRNVAYYFSYPIIDPYGTRDAFRYVIEPFYGSSDHQVYNDRGVPAVLFNHWPDMVYHTSHDRTDRMDATALKRACFIAAATGLVVAGAPEVEPLTVAGEAMTRSQARIASDMRRWMTLATTIEPTGEALSSFTRDFLAAVDAFRAREGRNVRSVLELTRGSTSSDPAADRKRIEALANLVESGVETDRKAAWRFMEGLAQAHGVVLKPVQLDDSMQRAAAMVPRWKGERPGFVRVPARGLPGFTSMEVRNFIDGSRSALAIRDAVNAEYAPTYGMVDLDAVVAYLEALEKAGLIEIERR